MINYSIGKYCIVRGNEFGVFAGILVAVDNNGKTVQLADARRIWYWDGAASLSELALMGTSKPEKCKFPAPVQDIVLNGVIEIIPCTLEAEASIRGVEVWTAR